MQPGVVLYTHDYLRTFRSPVDQEYGHGILDALKVLDAKLAWFRYRTIPDSLNGQLTPAVFSIVYGVTVTALALLMTWKLHGMPMLNQVLGAYIALTLPPPSAADYTL